MVIFGLVSLYIFFTTLQQAELAQLYHGPKFLHKLRLTNKSEYPLTTAPAAVRPRPRTPPSSDRETLSPRNTCAISQRDAPMAERLRGARSRDRVLRYVGSLDAATGKASVGLVELERSHTFANINLTDNVVRFLTQRYNQNPLVVQGPGAGPVVTRGSAL